MTTEMLRERKRLKTQEFMTASKLMLASDRQKLQEPKQSELMLIFSYFLCSKWWQEVQTTLFSPLPKYQNELTGYKNIFFLPSTGAAACGVFLLLFTSSGLLVIEQSEWVRTQLKKCNKRAFLQSQRQKTVGVCLWESVVRHLSAKCPRKDGKNAAFIRNRNILGFRSKLTLSITEDKKLSMTWSVFTDAVMQKCAVCVCASVNISVCV